jgi:CheY-like chemotaxis protein
LSCELKDQAASYPDRRGRNPDPHACGPYGQVRRFRCRGSPERRAISILEDRLDITAVFTDIQMPGSMDGLTLAAAIRGRRPPIKIVATSGLLKFSENDLPADSRFLAKPYSAPQIIGTLPALFEFNSAELNTVRGLVFENSKECPMANNKNPNKKRPGEKVSGKYHYNPGNMSGKTVKTGEEGSEKKNDVDRMQSRDELPKEHS